MHACVVGRERGGRGEEKRREKDTHTYRTIDRQGGGDVCFVAHGHTK